MIFSKTIYHYIWYLLSYTKSFILLDFFCVIVNSISCKPLHYYFYHGILHIPKFLILYKLTNFIGNLLNNFLFSFFLLSISIDSNRKRISLVYRHMLEWEQTKKRKFFLMFLHSYTYLYIMINSKWQQKQNPMPMYVYMHILTHPLVLITREKKKKMLIIYRYIRKRRRGTREKILVPLFCLFLLSFNLNIHAGNI